MDLGIRGKKALICAASRGLGKATALALAQEGVEVILCARKIADLKKAAEEIQAQGSQPVHYFACDLSSQNDREQLIQAVQEKLGSVDILIHNTGGPAPTIVQETSQEEWEQGFQQLFMSVAHLNQAFLPDMKKQRWGRIILVTSIAVLEPAANLAISNAIRSAVTSMAKTLATEVAPFNITINSVAPGMIHTDRTEALIENLIQKRGGTRLEHLEAFEQAIPAQRLGTPEEFASVVAFLCSQQAAYISGSTLCVDGGKRRSTY